MVMGEVTCFQTYNNKKREELISELFNYVKVPYFELLRQYCGNYSISNWVQLIRMLVEVALQSCSNLSEH